jgi:hypothetical protein
MDVRIPDGNVASTHCKIHIGAMATAVLEVQDTGVATAVNSQLVQKRMLLSHRDVISVGEWKIRYELPVSYLNMSRPASSKSMLEVDKPIYLI